MRKDALISYTDMQTPKWIKNTDIQSNNLT